MQKAYKPRRATKRWLAGAPLYILDCFDNKGRTLDRYTIMLGGDTLGPELLKRRQVQYLSMSASPSHPQGVSCFGVCDAAYRPSHQRVRWVDLPSNIRDYVANRVCA